MVLPRIHDPRTRSGDPPSFSLGAVGGLLLLAAALVSMLVVGMVLPDRALAEDPFRLTSQIEDRSGALGFDKDEVEDAVEGLRSGAKVDLWVVYVDDFSGWDSDEWVFETADLSDLGLNDVLLAVAVEDRVYSYTVDPDFELSDDEMADIMVEQVEPELQSDDWAGAAIAAANGLSQEVVGEVVAPASTAATQAGTASGAEEGGGFLWGGLIAVLVVVAVIALIVLAVRRSRKKGGAPGPADQAGATRTMTIAELRKRVGQQIVATDDAIKTSAEEVGFAVAEFGEAEAAPFQKALEEAQVELAEAFKIYRQFDDKADEETQRQVLNAVLQHTGAANERLDAQVEHFDKLRALETRAPEVLATLEGEVTALEARVPEVKKQLAGLAGEYAAVALKAVASNPDEAVSRLAFAREKMAAGLKAVTARKLGVAAVATLAAQEATGQARAFLDGVGRLGKELGEARDKIDAAVAETRRDIAEAQAAGAGTSGAGTGAQLAPLVATAEEAVRAAAEAAGPNGGRDPLEALRRLEEADAALEEVLGQVRDEQAQRAKAAASLDRTLSAAFAQIRAAGDYVSTHRGAIGAQPRQLLAEAQSYANQATLAGAADPVTALKHATVAHELASRALSEAQRETQQAANNSGIPGLGMGSTIVGALLGGILSSALGGGSSAGRAFGRPGGGVFGSGGSRVTGGGSFGRAMSRGGFAPPSFGGTGTRMRRGGGGRF